MLWVWIAVIVVACILEWLTQVQLISIWAALGGVVALILELAGAGKEIQVVVFFAVTIAAIVLTRPLAKKMTSFIKTPTNADMNIDKIDINIPRAIPLSPQYKIFIPLLYHFRIRQDMI